MTGLLFGVVSIVLAFVFVMPVTTIGMPQQQSNFTNIRVLNDLSDQQISQEMRAWTKALGVNCTYCHNIRDYSSDEVAPKETARRMANMVKTINKEFFKGEAKAGCILCHRGSAVPSVEN
jgi:hypothetical protein